MISSFFWVLRGVAGFVVRGFHEGCLRVVTGRHLGFLLRFVLRFVSNPKP